MWRFWHSSKCNSNHNYTRNHSMSLSTASTESRTIIQLCWKIPTCLVCFENVAVVCILHQKNIRCMWATRETTVMKVHSHKNVLFVQKHWWLSIAMRFIWIPHSRAGVKCWLLCVFPFFLSFFTSCIVNRLVPLLVIIGKNEYTVRRQSKAIYRNGNAVKIDVYIIRLRPSHFFSVSFYCFSIVW